MATRIFESAQINAPLDKVWAFIRPLNFKFLSTVQEAQEGLNDVVGSVRQITYKDRTVQKIKLLELSDARTMVTYEIIESDPPIPVMSVVHTIRCRRVSELNTTYVEWTSDYSRDASADVLSDSRFKKLDFFKDLQKAINKKQKKKLVAA